MRASRHTLAALGCLVIAAAPLAAQRARSSISTWTPDAASASSIRPDEFIPDSVRTTGSSHWLTGGIVGSVVLGVGGGLAGLALCGIDDSANASDNCTRSTLGLSVVGAALGFGIGAMIGSLFPKTPAVQVP
jgi:hypothetical protein